MKKIIIVCLILLFCKEYYAGVAQMKPGEVNSLTDGQKNQAEMKKIDMSDIKFKKIREAKIFDDDVMLADPQGEGEAKSEAAGAEGAPGASSAKSVGLSLTLIPLAFAAIMM